MICQVPKPMTGISPPFAKLTVLVTRRVLPGRATPHALVAKVVGTSGGGREGGPDAGPHDRCAGAGDGRAPAPRSGGGRRAGGDGPHRGVEYAATSTQGRFGGATDGQVRGAWQATVVHDPLGPGKTVPITDGSFTLRSMQREVRGTLVSGTVTPRHAPSTCGHERLDVRGTLALPGGRGSFTAVLTHLRVPSRSACRGVRRGRRRHARAPGVTVGGPK